MWAIGERTRNALKLRCVAGPQFKLRRVGMRTGACSDRSSSPSTPTSTSLLVRRSSCAPRRSLSPTFLYLHPTRHHALPLPRRLCPRLVRGCHCRRTCAYLLYVQRHLKPSRSPNPLPAPHGSLAPRFLSPGRMTALRPISLHSAWPPSVSTLAASTCRYRHRSQPFRSGVDEPVMQYELQSIATGVNVATTAAIQFTPDPTIGPNGNF